MIRKTELILNQSDILTVIANGYDVEPENVSIRVKLVDRDPARFDIQAIVRLEDEEE